MLQFFIEMMIAILAVYGGYTALHDLAALICKWIGAPEYRPDVPRQIQGKEDSCQDGGGDSNELRGSDSNEFGTGIGRSDASSAGRDD